MGKVYWVGELPLKDQKEIRKNLENAIREMGFYTEEEVQEHVQRAMDSKLLDLEDTIDISQYRK